MSSPSDSSVVKSLSSEDNPEDTPVASAGQEMTKLDEVSIVQSQESVMIGEQQLDQDMIEENLLAEDPVDHLGVQSASPAVLDEAALLEEGKEEESTAIAGLVDGQSTETIEDDMFMETAETAQIDDQSESQFAGYEQDYFQSFTAHEVGRCSWDKAVKQNYLRGCLWSPDGSCVLTAVNNDGMHVFELPSDLYGVQEVSPQRPVNLLDSAVHVRETTLVYDYKWYPGMHSSMPETSVWIASRQHEPIQMWDAYTGNLRCSYKGYNAVDEVEAALSLTWSLDGAFIYGGYKKSIKTFDVKAPGREISSFPTKVTASCMTVCPPVSNLLIFGSWSRSITAFSTNSNQTIQVGNNSRDCSHNAGVTWLRFIPRTNLFASGGRKDNKLMLWDIRSLQKPYHVLERSCDTNQRVYFDASPYGEWLGTGSTDGLVRVWNLRDIDAESKSYRKYDFPLHRDCCNGIAFHPSRPIVASTSGQFHPAVSDDSFDQQQQQPQQTEKPRQEVENSLTLWWIGKAISEE